MCAAVKSQISNPTTRVFCLAALLVGWLVALPARAVVQAATALGGTNAFTDLSASITLVGVGPVTTNYLDLGVLTNQPARFYRIRTN